MKEMGSLHRGPQAGADLGEQDLQLAGRAGRRVGTVRSSWNLLSPLFGMVSELPS